MIREQSAGNQFLVCGGAFNVGARPNSAARLLLLCIVFTRPMAAWRNALSISLIGYCKLNSLV